MPTRLSCAVNDVATWSLSSSKDRRDPWCEIELFATVTGPDSALEVPAFWAGERRWGVRFCPCRAGTYGIRTRCSDTSDALHGQEAVLEAMTVPSDNPLVRHGAVRVAKGRPSFEHADGTPFFWLGDTWWMAASDRIGPDGFRTLVADRAAKGFTVVQIVLGFPCDTTPFDGRERNEGGAPWEAGYGRINPRYFDHADARIACLVGAGIVPCILGGWGYHLLFMGEERMVQHWRYLVARYAAYPVVFCLAGEAAMPFYLSKQPGADSEKLVQAWARVGRAVRDLDPFHRSLTIHPRVKSWEDIAAPELCDLHMLQPGHLPLSLERAVELIGEARDRFAEKPVVNAEPPYEGHMGTNGPDVQRYSFWSSVLSGAAGFTYGAAGIFQANDRERPTGNRPDGGAFDAAFWDEAIAFDGARQIGIGKACLAELPFDRFEPHPEWATAAVRWGAEQYRPPFRVYGAGMAGQCAVLYVPTRFYHWDGPVVRDLTPGVGYTGFYMDPATGIRTDLGVIRADADGVFRGPIVPYLHDWVVVIRRA